MSENNTASDSIPSTAKAEDPTISGVIFQSAKSHQYYFNIAQTMGRNVIIFLFE